MLFYVYFGGNIALGILWVSFWIISFVCLVYVCVYNFGKDIYIYTAWVYKCIWTQRFPQRHDFLCVISCLMLEVSLRCNVCVPLCVSGKCI